MLRIILILIFFVFPIFLAAQSEVDAQVLNTAPDTLQNKVEEPIYLSAAETEIKLKYIDALNKGTVDALRLNKKNTGLLMGWTGGMILNLPGTFLTYNLVSGSKPKVIPNNLDVTGYKDGYWEMSKKMNKEACLSTGFIASASVPFIAGCVYMVLVVHALSHVGD